MNPAEPPANRARILIVDDSPDSARVLAQAVDGLGEVFVCTEALQAYEVACNTCPEVILLDIEMPGMSGFELARKLRDDGRTAGSSVVFVTGHDPMSREPDSFRLGAVDFITKPINLETCRLRVANQLQLKRAQRELFQEKERLRVTLNSIGDAVVAVDDLGRVTFMNPIAEQMTGWSAQQALDQPVEIVMPLVEGESGRELQNPVYLALREKRTVAMALNCRLNALGGVHYQVEDSAAPIRDADGNIRGAIIVFHDVSEARAMAIKMSHLANHDPLTDLPNRVLLQDRISLAIRRASQRGSRVGLILFDIDNFKITNNVAGHLLGDRVIQLLASRLQRLVPGGATLARLGGDEFVVLVPELDSPESIAELSLLLSAEARLPVVFEDQQLDVTLSGGISIYPDDCEDEEGLLRNADVAMFRAKEDGRNQTHFYSSELEQRLVKRVTAQRELRDALDEDRLVVHYQAMYDASGREIIGAEALVRLQSREGKLVPPMDFIPLAEETGLIIPIGERVLKMACQTAAGWRKRWPDFRISVNISARQFADPSLLAAVKTVLEETGTPPGALELEITENTLMSDISAASELMRRFRRLGVRLSIDDFGTGYSSLTYLRSFPAQTLKLDQAFVRGYLDNAGDLAIVRAIITLGHALGMELVAEGVETQDQASHLAEMGCHTLQGYLFSRPVPEHQFPG